jgi:hypothetical protein
MLPEFLREGSMIGALFGIGITTVLGFFAWITRRPADPEHLRTVSNLMAYVATGAAVIVPAVVFAKYVDPSRLGPLNGLIPLHLGGTGEFPLTDDVAFFNRMIAFACAAVPLAIAVWSLLSTRRLFRLYAHQDVFSRESFALLSSISLALCLYVLTSFLAEAPITAALSLGRVAGPHGMSLTLKIEDLSVLFVAGLIRVFAQVMAHAIRAADENASFV